MQRSQIHRTPRSLTCIDQVAGRSSTVVPHTPQLVGSGSSGSSTSRVSPDPVPGSTVSDMTTDEPQVDPHYLDLLRGSKLPQAYLPPMMVGPRKPWIRVFAAIVIGCFLAATTCGVCLTYGISLGG